MNNPLLVSVVVPAYNCQKTILKTIQAVLRQTYSPLELIVVDDGSTDGTSQIVRRCQGVRYVCQNNAGPAAARNRGAKEARGKIILFTDADCVPQKDWVDLIVTGFQEPEIGVVAGSYGIANPEHLLARCVHKEILFRHHHFVPSYPKVFGSYNFGVRKNVLKKVGGFNEEYRYASGEDNDLSYRILKEGYKIYFRPQALVDHFHPVSVRKYLREQYRHGFWRVKMYLQHPRMIKGDDYTFWKDIIEVPLSLLVIISVFVSELLFSVVVSVLFFLEIGYGFMMTRHVFEGFFWGITMFLRSFARMLGFVSGAVFLLRGKKLSS